MSEGKGKAKVSSYDRKDSAIFLGVGSFHVGELIRKGKFPGAYKKEIEGRKTQKWWIPIDELKAYKATRQAGVGKRADGRTKYTIYLTSEEKGLLMDAAAAKDADTFPPIVRANPPKAA